MKRYFELFKETWTEFSEDKAQRLAAALAYYTLFSIAPLLLIAIAIAGLIFVKSQAQSAIVMQLRTLMGDAGAKAIEEMLISAAKPKTSFAVITVLFAMIFRYLPDIRIEWHDVWLGAAFTSFLFVLGKFALGLDLGKSAIGSSYGAAGSLVVLLVWIYWSTNLLFFGGEFTQVYARRHGSRTGERKAVSGERKAVSGERKAETNRLPAPRSRLPSS